jgi:hypothetical protein
MTTVFVSLFNALDDFSYYSYHKRNYSSSVVVFMALMTNFTLTRFLPPVLKNIYDNINLSYKD